MTMQLEMNFKFFLTSSSMSTGATFSPPAVMISSLIRPVIVKLPCLSILPTSPEWRNPSLSSAALVAYSSLKYPMKTCLPL
jgi:hypothetical protein